jgi:hypothetical protein
LAISASIASIVSTVAFAGASTPLADLQQPVNRRRHRAVIKQR